MNHFEYRNGELFAEEVPLRTIAAQVGTPFYCYSTATLERHYQVFSAAFADIDALVCYALKANSNQAVIATLARLGAGADVVSGGELRPRAEGRRAAAKDHVLRRRQEGAGTGRGSCRRHPVLQRRIRFPSCICCRERAAASGRTARVSFRINPDVDAGTHAKISTGKKHDKFGIAWEDAHEVYSLAATLPGIEVTGIDMHIGSQITELAPFDQRLCQAGGPGARTARRRATPSSMSISAAGSAFPIARTTCRRPNRAPMPASSRSMCARSAAGSSSSRGG